MVTWMEFADERAPMAAKGQKLLEHGIAYLATTRQNGAPRVHPVTPILAAGHLYVAIPETSPKCKDLLRDGRYALHALPGTKDDEFMMAGRVSRITDSKTRRYVTESAGHVIRDTDYIFEFLLDRALSGHWEYVGLPNTFPVREWWHERAPASP